MFQQFIWEGQPIIDIDEWRKERGERMVYYTATREIPNILSGKMYTETQEGSMPESFWKCRRLADGWIYKEKI